MNARSVTLILGLGLLQGSLAAAQNTVPPPPRPDEATLLSTMTDIESELNNQGGIYFVINIENRETDQKNSVLIFWLVKGVEADTGQCRISFHYRKDFHDGTASEADTWFPLSDIRSLTVIPYITYLNNEAKREGKTGFRALSTDQPITMLIVHLPRSGKYFLFKDADLADRVARQLNRAVELCGGGN